MPASNSMNHQNFLNQLGKYVNHGSLNKSDIFFGHLLPLLPFKKNATHLCELHSKINHNSSGYTINVHFQKYSGTNLAVNKISDFIKAHLINDVRAVLIHGSLATQEEIPYSDFDALVILKDEIFKNKKRLASAAINLSKVYSMMLEFDPLQHHGWFAMSETNLKHYPVNPIYPRKCFPYCYSLLEPLELSITTPVEDSLDSNLFRLINSLKKQLHPKYIPNNLFIAKSILSEFMMLPTLFIQQKKKKGIYKKFSFAEAQQFFTHQEWKVMDEVSDIRKYWNKCEAKLPFNTPCVISVSKKKNQKANSPKLPQNLTTVFKSGLAERMLKFIDTMILKTDET